MKLNKKKLDISIIVGGRFHAFDLAQQLDKYKCLNCLVTSYPKFYLKKFNINRKKIKSFLYIELIKRLSKKLLNFFNMNLNDYFFNDHFDDRASKVDYKSNVIIGWSGFSKKTFLKNKNKILVLERGSSHILFQNQILKKAYEDLHIPYKSINEKLIKKELDEYEIADFISVPSIFAKNSFLEKKFLNTKLIQVPLGVNLNDFYRFKNKEKNDKLRIIYVGQLSVRKGIIYLLEAFDELTNTKKYKNIELVCIGDIDFEIEKKINSFKRNNKIFFIGSKKQQDLINYYNSSDIFILPSLEEGLAMVQLQALACGVPVVSTKNSGAEDIIENNTNGLIIEPFSVNDIKDKIIYFIENRQMISIFSNKAIESSRKFTWEIYSKKLINIYENILAENNKISE